MLPAQLISLTLWKQSLELQLSGFTDLNALAVQSLLFVLTIRWLKMSFSMISLAYDDTLMAAAGEQDHQALEDVMKKFDGNYILAVEASSMLGRRRCLLYSWWQTVY